ncbi:MAG: transposase zinc-binding domain-containing protein [Blautia faecis]
MYGCPHCGKLKFVPFRCHSRFCPTCGNKYSYGTHYFHVF